MTVTVSLSPDESRLNI